MATLIMLFK